MRLGNPIRCKDKDGNEYQSASKAALDLGLNRRTISNKCLKKKEGWEYIIDEDLPNEIWMWHPIGEMLVSNFGRVSSDKYTVHYGTLRRDGYRATHIKEKGFLVHVLVAEMFLNNFEDKPIVNHKDSDRSNNNVENLEWCTHSENALHRWNKK